MDELKHCLSCGGQVSQNAEACPHCGEPEPASEHKHRIHELREQGFERVTIKGEALTKTGRQTELKKLIRKREKHGWVYDGYEEDPPKILAFFYVPPGQKTGGFEMTGTKFALISTFLILGGLIGYGAIFGEPPTKQEIAAQQHQEKMEGIADKLESDLMLACDQFIRRWAKYPDTVDEDFLGMKLESNPEKRTAFYAQQFTAKNGFGVPVRFTAKCEFEDGSFNATVVKGYTLN